MNSFVNVDYPNAHPGVERLERAAQAASQWRESLSPTRGLAATLLAAMVATLILAVDRVMDTWADAHLLAAWVLMWVIGFAALALLAPTARALAARAMAVLDGWSRRTAYRRADERLWDLARRDPRVMADLRAAASRAEEQAADDLVSSPQVPASAYQSRARVERLSRRIWNE
jgi:hypothetical protein